MQGRNQDLVSEFAAICRDYFFDWATVHRWTLKQGPRAGWIGADGEYHHATNKGWCSHDTMTLWINDDRTAVERKATVIHEICHAITGKRHSKRFVVQMDKAAQRALELDDPELEAELRQHLNTIKAPRDVDDIITCSGHVARPETLYDRLWELAFDNPTTAFARLVDSIAAVEGLTPQEFHAACPRAKALYDETIDLSLKGGRMASRYIALPEVRANVHGPDW